MRLRFYLLYLFLLWTTLTAGAQQLTTGEGVFTYSEFAPFAERPVDVHYYIPSSGDPSQMPIIFVFQGNDRDWTYLMEAWKTAAETNRFMVFIPQWDTADWPTNDYQEGRVMISAAHTVLTDPQETTHSLVDKMFEYVRSHTATTRTTYRIYGHSAGGQFVQRFSLLHPSPYVDRAVLGCPGWYTFPDRSLGYSYGLGGVTYADDAFLQQRFLQDVVVQLGDQDINVDYGLRVTDEANAQGANRYERGLNYYAYCKQLCQDNGWTFNWTQRIEPGIAHESVKMGMAAVPLLLEAKGDELAGVWAIGAEGSIGSPAFGEGTEWLTEHAIRLQDLGNNIYALELTVGQQLNKDQVNFKFFPQAGWGNEFTGLGSNGYTLTTTDEVFGIGDGTDWHNNGNIYLRDGQTLQDGDTYVFFVDCSRGTSQAVLTVQQKPATVDGIWIIGAPGSVGSPNFTEGTDWKTEQAMALTKVADNVFSYTLTVGKELNKDHVNFKFFGQAGWGVEYLGTGVSAYRLMTDSPLFGIGTGSDGHDNGNIYLREGQTLTDGDTYTFTIDLTAGTDKGVLTVTKQEAEPPLTFQGVWLIGADGSVGVPAFETGDEWHTERAIALTKGEDNRYTVELTVGQQLNKDQVNFKFFGQAGWGIEFQGTADAPYRLTTESAVFGIGDGTDWHDNGNIYLRDGQTLTDGDTYVFTIDLTRGYADGLLTVTKSSGQGGQEDPEPVPAPSGGRVVVAYVTSWSTGLPDPTKMTHINYSFCHVNASLTGLDIDNESRLREIVALKQQNPQLKVVLSIGGGGGSQYLSEMCADATARRQFAQACRQACADYGVDGVDLDWEFPGDSDEANFVALVRDLRVAMGSDLLITMASTDNASHYRFGQFVDYMDYVNIMAYNMGGQGCHHAAMRRGGPVSSGGNCWNTVEESVAAHLAAGVPASKLVLGMPFYGNNSLYQWDSEVSLQQINDYLAQGYERRWDSVAEVPYLVDANGAFFFGYDDAESMAVKCQYVVDNGLLGGMYWEYNEDDNAGTLRSVVHDRLLGAAEPEGLWIIGADGSVGDPAYGEGTGWHPERAMAMEEVSEGVYSLTLTVGQTLNKDLVDFKFFGQAGWGIEFLGTAGATYRLTSDSPLFRVGTGSDGHDNGNIYLMAGQSLDDGDQVTVTVDCTQGYGDAVLYTAVVKAVPNGIAAVEAPAVGSTFYTLQGQRTDRPRKGVYISGGRKVVVR